MNSAFIKQLQSGLDDLASKGTLKKLNHLASPQSARVQMEGRGEVLILSSNNYLGLCDQPEVVDAGIAALQKYGAGTASGRFNPLSAWSLRATAKRVVSGSGYQLLILSFAVMAVV